MRLTRAAEYAVRCVLFLARHGRGVLCSRQEIARCAEIPSHFLAKIAQDLARAEILEIRQGAKGGFLLLRDPAKITLLEVVEIMIGEIYLNDCVARPSGCKESPKCPVHRVWQEARHQLRSKLAEVTIEQLVTDDSCIGRNATAEPVQPLPSKIV